MHGIPPIVFSKPVHRIKKTNNNKHFSEANCPDRFDKEILYDLDCILISIDFALYTTFTDGRLLNYKVQIRRFIYDYQNGT